MEPPAKVKEDTSCWCSHPGHAIKWKTINNKLDVCCDDETCSSFSLAIHPGGDRSEGNGPAERKLLRSLQRPHEEITHSCVIVEDAPSLFKRMQRGRRLVCNVFQSAASMAAATGEPQGISAVAPLPLLWRAYSAQRARVAAFLKSFTRGRLACAVAIVTRQA